AAAEAAGGLALGGEVLGLDALVHQAGGFQGNGLAELDISHPFVRRYEAHQRGAGPWDEGPRRHYTVAPAGGTGPGPSGPARPGKRTRPCPHFWLPASIARKPAPLRAGLSASRRKSLSGGAAGA